MTSTEICMSGSLVERHRRTLRELLTESLVDRSLRTLPADQREEFLEASTLSWVRIPTLSAAFSAIAAEAGRDAAELQVQVVKKSVTENLGTVWRLFLSMTDDEFLTARIPRLYNRAYNGGRCVVGHFAKNEATFSIEGWPDMPNYARRGIAAGAEQILTLAGRKDARVRWASTAGLVPTQFSLRWAP